MAVGKAAKRSESQRRVSAQGAQNALIDALIAEFREKGQGHGLKPSSLKAWAPIATGDREDTARIVRAIAARVLEVEQMKEAGRLGDHDLDQYYILKGDCDFFDLR